MSTFVFANNVSTTLASPASSSQTTITLSSTSNLPTIPSGDRWALTLNDAATGANFEIVYVTAISGANLTVLRGQDGTAAQSWATNDKVFAAVTAGILSSFSQESGEFVELSPSSPQSGNISITGDVTAEGSGSFSGLSVGGELSNATTGSFSAEITAQELTLSQVYGETNLADLPLTLKGASGIIGLGASSALSQRGITATALAIGLAGSEYYTVFDESGSIGLAGDVAANNGTFAGEVQAVTILQDGIQVIDSITSPDDSIIVDSSGGSVTVVIGDSYVGQTIVAEFNPTSTQINDGYAASLPSELPTGAWFVEIICNGFGLPDTGGNIDCVGTGGTYASQSSLTAIAMSRTLYVAGSASAGETPGLSLSGNNVDYAAGSTAIFATIKATRIS